MKIIFFSPFSGVLPHIKSEVLLANGLSKAGHDILFVNCDGAFDSFCICMAANGLNEFSNNKLKADQCSSCQYIRNCNNSHFKFKHKYIHDNLLEEEKIQIKKIINGINKNNWSVFTYDDFEIGKISSYEVLINYKKNDYEFFEEEWQAYLIALENTLITYFVFKKILEKEKPDAVMYYDAGYSVNGIVKALAIRSGILAYDYFGNFNISDRCSRLMIAKEDSNKLFNYLKKNAWDKYKNTASSRKEIINTRKHFEALFKARDVFAYSSARDNNHKDIRSFFGVPADKKLLVATLSSHDERFAEEVLGRTTKESETIFSSQVDWCSALVKWVEDKNNYFLIIRVHPREFPNKRENRKSIHADKLQLFFNKLPNNVKINWPTDNVSIYNLAEEADVFLNAWSSVGAEMSLLGLPVVVYSEKLLYYPGELNYYGSTREEYFSKIDEASLSGWDFERIRLAYRWYAIIFSLSSIKIDENFQPLRDFLRRGFGLLRKITRLQFFNRLSHFFYIYGSRFSKKNVKLVEKMIINRSQSLVDVCDKDINKVVDKNLETFYIKEEMEKLYKGIDSGIIKKIRAHNNK